MEQTKREMAEKASLLYYENNKSQNTIADEMGISRSYVSQLLAYAKKNGIIKVTINIDKYKLRMLRKEIEFKAMFPNLKQVYIMNSDSETFTQKNLSSFAVPYITELINNSKVIGINLGKSVEEAIESLDEENASFSDNKKVVQIMGGFHYRSQAFSNYPNEMVQKLSKVLNCEYYFLNCPAVVKQKELKKQLLQEQSIQEVVNLWNDIDLAIMGIGVADKRSKLLNLLDDETILKIEKEGLEGEINLCFFDKEGNYVPLLEDNKISMPYETLKKIDNKVIICGAEYKKKALLSALKGDMIDTLITDSIVVDAIENML